MKRVTATSLRTVVAVPALVAFATLTACGGAAEDGTFEDEGFEDASSEGEEIASSEAALETYASSFTLIAAHSGKCLTIDDGNQVDGAPIRQRSCDGADDQTLTLDPTGDGYYRLIAKHSGKCVDVSEISTANGASVWQWACHTMNNQKFKPVPSNNGYYSLVAKHSGKCVDVSEISTADGAGVWQWACHGGANQQWKLAAIETRGNSLYGAWTGSGGQSPNSSANRTFIVDYKGPTRSVTFDLAAPVDGYLYLLDKNGNVLAEDNNGGGGTNARVTYTLSTGTYKLVAATFATGQSAEFAISSNLASLRYPQNLYVQPASLFTWVYDDAGTGADDDVSIWRPDLSKYPGYYSLGDVAMPNHGGPPRATFVVKGDGNLLAKPVDYNFVWDDKGSGGDHDGSFWEPVAPQGYTCLGHVANGGYGKPSTDLIRCVKSAYVLSAGSFKVWDDSGSGANKDLGIWQVAPYNYRGLPTSTFVSRQNHNDDGGAGRYRVLNKSATANEELRGGPVTGLSAVTFAPRVRMDPGETYFPSSAAFFQAAVHEENGFLVTNESLGCANCTDPAFLDGQRPDQNHVPVYAEIVKRTGTSVDITDVIYWMFYPYNNGKLVCMGYVDNGCKGAGQKRFGNHVGDWEHMTLRFIDGRPAEVYLAQHSDGDTFAYGQKELELQGWHAGTYAAKGSHGLYADAGKHVYQSLPNNDVLVDYTGAGMAWDTWNTVVPFEYQPIGSYTGELSFLNIQSRWGNRKQECGAFDSFEVLAGECVLNDGPEAPIVKGFAKPSYTGLK